MSEKRAEKRARAQHAEWVVGEGDLGIERGAQSAGGQITQAVEGIDELHVG